jgi:hypothetical protein
MRVERGLWGWGESVGVGYFIYVYKYIYILYIYCTHTHMYICENRTRKLIKYDLKRRKLSEAKGIK